MVSQSNHPGGGAGTYYYNAKLVRVVDGDTVEADVDLGFDTHQRVMLRLAGIDTPESRGPESNAGRLATQITEEWIRGLGGEFCIDCLHYDRWGRSVAVIAPPGPKYFYPQTLNFFLFHHKIGWPTDSTGRLTTSRDLGILASVDEMKILYKELKAENDRDQA